jgi:hypothetical protein
MDTHRVGLAVLLLCGAPGSALSFTQRRAVEFPGALRLQPAPSATNQFTTTLTNAPEDYGAIFGGYVNESSLLTAVATDGQGRYAVVGATDVDAYLGVFDSFGHERTCESAFEPVDALDPLRFYDQGHALAVTFGDGVVYVAGEAHHTGSSDNDFDAFLQAFDPCSCDKLGPAVIDGGVHHDAFNAVAYSAAGVIAVGYTATNEGEVFLAERWTADLSSPIYQLSYGIEGTTGGNHTNAVAFDDLGNAWTFGFVHFTPAPADQRLERHALNPDGSVRNTTFFFNSDSGPSQYTSAQLGPDGLIYAAGTIVNSRLPVGPGPFALFEAGYSPDLTSPACSVAIQGTVGSSGMDLEGGDSLGAYLFAAVDPASSLRPGVLLRLHAADCTASDAPIVLGSSDGIDVPGGLAYDSSTQTVRIVAATSGTDYSPNTDGSVLAPPQNGFQSEFGPSP